jgi:anti-sigma-K factor RskA
MTSSMHVTELLPAYALGCLDEEEAGQVAGHLAACPACQAQLQSYVDVAGQLALAAPDAAPPSALKGRILGWLQTSQAGRPAELDRPWWQQAQDLFRRPGRAWGAVALLLVALLIASNLWWWLRPQRQGRPASGGEMQAVALAGTAAAPQASGLLVISAGGEYGTLIVDGLPALDSGHEYQLWLIRDGQRTSGGLLTVGADGYASLPISSPEPLSSYTAFGLTVEPAGGSPGPTGAKVLGSEP